MPRLDHFVVTAPDLVSGAAYVSETLGADLPSGGAHPLTSTHNCLGGTGGGTYFEVIAADPTAAAPSRARPYGLETKPDAPRFATWVIAVDNMDAALGAAAAHGIETGPAVRLTRDTLAWDLTIPDDGSMPFGGTAPSIIAWPPGVHPSQTLPASGVTFERLEIRHPRANALGAMFEDMGGLPTGVVLQSGADARRATFRDATDMRRQLTSGDAPWT